MFHRKSKAIVPYPDNKITPSNGVITTSSDRQLPIKDLNTDVLNQMRDTQMISNYEYMSLALLREILAKLNKIEYNTRSTAVSSEFLGKYVLNKFKWF